MANIKKWFLGFTEALKAAYLDFFKDDCYTKASALSFYTLLAIIPVLAVAFGVAKGFGFEKNLEAQLLENFYQQPQLVQKMIEFAHSALENARGGLIAGIGVIFLFWTAFGLLGNFEYMLNTIWKISEMRPWSRRIPDYITLLFLSPIFLIVTGSLTLFIITTIVEYSRDTGYYNAARPFIYLFYYLLLFSLSWILFSFIYYFMPNRKVPLNASIFAGILAGTLFQIIQWGYIHFQIYVTSYNAIYGSFAAIPLFLIWLQLSWLITLIGAEVSSHLAAVSE